MSATAGVLLDRDGIITGLVTDASSGKPESPYRPEDVTLLPGAAGALRRLAAAGLPVGIVSNQPAAAKGKATEADLDAVHARTVELLGDAAEAIGHWGYCRHHPDAIDPALRECDCRKPKPGLLLEAAKALGFDLGAAWMVGDSDVDVLAGQAASCRTILVEHADSAHRRPGDPAPDLRAADLADAVELILAG